MADALVTILMIAWMGAGLAFLVWLFVLLPADMATARNRSSVAWVLVSLFFSPVAAIILLWVLGAAEKEGE